MDPRSNLSGAGSDSDNETVLRALLLQLESANAASSHKPLEPAPQPPAQSSNFASLAPGLSTATFLSALIHLQASRVLELEQQAERARQELGIRLRLAQQSQAAYLPPFPQQTRGTAAPDVAVEGLQAFLASINPDPSAAARMFVAGQQGSPCQPISSQQGPLFQTITEASSSDTTIPVPSVINTNNPTRHRVEASADERSSVESRALARAESPRARKGRSVPEPFPQKLMRMIEECEAGGLSSVLSFAADGQSFIVHNPSRFLHEIIPVYFRHNSLPSFKRQMLHYNFRHEPTSDGTGLVYSHPCFRRGGRQQLHMIRRQSSSSRQSSTAKKNEGR